jgi:N-hydroxyarylamine O-acetyltransferase
VLQTEEGVEWTDLYGFVPQPVPLVDVETSNWFTSTHPHSPFVKGLIVSTQTLEGTRTSMSDRGELGLTEQTPASTIITPISRDAIPGLLDTRFGLPGFTLNSENRVVRAAGPPHGR